MSRFVWAGSGLAQRLLTWDVFDLAGHLRVPFGPQPSERAASLAEDRVEEDPETARELDEVTCMTEPRCAQSGC